MQNMTSRLFLAAILAAFATQSSAQTVPTGPRCDGAAMIVCAPIAAAVIARKALQQGSTDRRLAAALEQGDADKAKRLLKKAMRRKPDAEKMPYLDAAAQAYLKDKEAAKQPARLEIVNYILGNIDLRGEYGSSFLQKSISDFHYTYESSEKYAERRLALVQAALAHGASARNVSLGNCRHCEADVELIPLLVRNGADIASSAPLLTSLVEFGYYDAARRLIELGADPDGAIYDWRGPLHHVAERCARWNFGDGMPPQELERLRRQCAETTISFARFAIGRGADPDGRSSVQTLCDTPYSLALQGGNKQLAETLRTLGADPGYSQRCKRHAPPGAVP